MITRGEESGRMSKILVVFDTTNGHTSRIAERIGEVVHDRGFDVQVCEVAQLAHDRVLEPFDGAIIGGPIYRGKHSRDLARFVKRNLDQLNRRHSAFFSVSLSAAGNKDQRSDAWRCLEEFLAQTHWSPSMRAIFAGALLYQEYGLLKRWLMKFIVGRAGGDTDTSQNYEYSNWEEVEEFANEFATQVGIPHREGNKVTRCSNLA